MIVLKATRKSDNEVLYFRDQESYDDYVLTYEEELTEPSFDFEVPFGKKVIDWNQQRANMSFLFKAAGIAMKDVSKSDLLGIDTKDHAYEDTEKRIKEARSITKKTFELQNGELVETDDDYREINIRKKKAINNDIFKSFIDGLDDIRHNAVVNVFIQHKLDLDKLEEYFDVELNMDISIWLQDYETQKDFLIAFREFKKTDTYKTHHNFIKAMEDAYEAVRKLDIDNDQKMMIPQVDLSEPSVVSEDQKEDLSNKVAVNGKLTNNPYN